MTAGSSAPAPSDQAAATTGRQGFDLRGMNPLVLVCRDMARTVDFYANVLGMPLVKTIALPAGRPDQGDLTSAVGSMNHVAFDVAPEQIEEYGARRMGAGVDRTEVANHHDSESGISDELHLGRADRA